MTEVPSLIDSLRQGVGGPSGEGGLEVWELRDAGPDVLGGGTHDAEDAEELVDLGVALEQRLLVGHLQMKEEMCECRMYPD